MATATAPKAPAAPVFHKFRLLVGTHIEVTRDKQGNPQYEWRMEEGTAPTGIDFETCSHDGARSKCPKCGATKASPISRQYKAGEIIETTQDLCKIYNQVGSEKFARIDGSVISTEMSNEELLAEARRRGLMLAETSEAEAAPQPQGFNDDATLEAMSADELKKWAAGEEIDLGDAKTKNAMLAVIRKVRAANFATAGFNS